MCACVLRSTTTTTTTTTTAGKLKEARQLCCQAGQAWRSLSLSAGGAWGPLPVGLAAEEASEALDGQVRACWLCDLLCSLTSLLHPAAAPDLTRLLLLCCALLRAGCC
jgi:hypothetical protein